MGTPEDISTAASDPERVSGDEGSIKERSISDKIAADRYEQSAKASRSKNPFRGLLFRQRPPGGSGQ